jgi:hypothetical protein
MRPTKWADVNGGHATTVDMALTDFTDTKQFFGQCGIVLDVEMVPLAGIEPALLAESDFESDASTSSAIGARAKADGADIKRGTAHGQCAQASRQVPRVDGAAASA